MHNLRLEPGLCTMRIYTVVHSLQNMANIIYEDQYSEVARVTQRIYIYLKYLFSSHFSYIVPGSHGIITHFNAEVIALDDRGRPTVHLIHQFLNIAPIQKIMLLNK